MRGCGTRNSRSKRPLTRVESAKCMKLGIRAGDILLATGQPTGLSARNVIRRKNYCRCDSKMSRLSPKSIAGRSSLFTLRLALASHSRLEAGPAHMAGAENVFLPCTSADTRTGETLLRSRQVVEAVRSRLTQACDEAHCGVVRTVHTGNVKGCSEAGWKATILK